MKVMGIVNATPDSFSDGGRYFSPEEAIRRAKNLISDGADIIDVGGESTRPEATPISWEEEWARIEPIVARLSREVCLSVDTYHPETAARAVECGASIVNCVYSESIPAMLDLIAKNDKVELIMPARYGAEHALPSCVNGRIYIDPMIGFGTSRDEDLQILRSIPELARRGRVVVGASRKRIVKKLTGEKIVGKNVGGNVAIAVWCAMSGASIVRVHDVKETVQAVRVIGEIRC